MDIKGSGKNFSPNINSSDFVNYSRPVKVAAASGRGFTFVELLVVIAVIGLLASILLVALNATRKSARDAKRKDDALQLRKAIELYYQDNAVYPNKGTVGSQNTATDIQNLASFLVPKYAARLPNDPTDSPYNYEYVWNSKGQQYGIMVPFGDDGGQDCMFMTSAGNANWFKESKKIPTCSYSQ